jgi:hypothetical protein
MWISEFFIVFSSELFFMYITALYIYAYGMWSQYSKSSKWVKEVANCSIVHSDNEQ